VNAYIDRHYRVWIKVNDAHYYVGDLNPAESMGAGFLIGFVLDGPGEPSHD
jgi:hypothetical protein